MKIIEIANVDFSLRQFLLPLMREMRARGHEVIGACAEGKFLDTPRAEGFRVVASVNADDPSGTTPLGLIVRCTP